MLTGRSLRSLAIVLIVSALLASGLTLGGCGSEATTVTTTVSDPGASTDVGASQEFRRRSRNGATEDPAAVVRRYYELVDQGDYDSAWLVLPPDVQAESGSFSEWRAGYETTISTRATNVRTDLQDERAVVSLDIYASDRDACGKRVSQTFAGTWSLHHRGGRWEADSADIEKVSGGTPTLSEAECSPIEPETTTTTRARVCTPGYSTCLPPASDYDCEGGTGDGPSFTGTVRVTGSDPYGLDADGNGVGCE